MKRLILTVLILCPLFAVRHGHSQAGLCSEEEYYSDFTDKCEKSQLLVGVGDTVAPMDFSAFEISDMTVGKNPAYEKNGTAERVRRYRGVRLRDMLKRLLPDGDSLEDYVMAITCLDGFDPVIDFNLLSRLSSVDALLAMRQLDIPGSSGSGITKDGRWELVPAAWGIISPGPFYLVWANPEGTYWQGWPFQIKSIRLIRARDYQDTLSRLEPAKEFLGQTPKSGIELGFDQFRGKCLTCHHLNGVGGKKARIDLLAVVQAFSDESGSLGRLKDAIQNPPSGMSDILDIKFSEKDLENLNLYLRHLSERN